MTSGNPHVQHVTRLSGNLLNREGATCCEGVFEVKILIIRPIGGYC
jgi:hypothetical protein